MKLFAILALSASCALAGPPGPYAKNMGPRIKLFNGKNLDGFYTFLPKQGKNHDPDHIFQIEKGVVHVSGQEFGYFVTEKEYSNYYLHAEFKWGEKTWEPRKDKARDSGILFHVNGEDKVWPQSIEFQMIEGGTGDILMVGGVNLTVKGVTKDKGRFDRFGKGAWKDVAGYRDPNGDVEHEHGKWNTVDLYAVGDTVTYYVNGKLVNEGKNAGLTKGHILFQSEGAEVFFRKMELREIKPPAGSPGMH